MDTDAMQTTVAETCEEGVVPRQTSPSRKRKAHPDTADMAAVDALVAASEAAAGGVAAGEAALLMAASATPAAVAAEVAAAAAAAGVPTPTAVSSRPRRATRAAARSAASERRGSGPTRGRAHAARGGAGQGGDAYGERSSLGSSGAYNRKDKSLGLLCEKFMLIYAPGKEENVSLDQSAKRLGVERRRIYDIVNVLESIDIVQRQAKNSYRWLGFDALAARLHGLEEKAKRDVNKLARAGAGNGKENPAGAGAGEGDESGPIAELVRKDFQLGMLAKVYQAQKRGRPEARREKSLGLLSQKFVQLFLVARDHTLSLEVGARAIMGDEGDDKQLKTKVRRLYDIANVLQSLHLIEKVHLNSTRKPAFRWLGEDALFASKLGEFRGLGQPKLSQAALGSARRTRTAPTSSSAAASSAASRRTSSRTRKSTSKASDMDDGDATVRAPAAAARVPRRRTSQRRAAAEGAARLRRAVSESELLGTPAVSPPPKPTMSARASSRVAAHTPYSPHSFPFKKRGSRRATPPSPGKNTRGRGYVSPSKRRRERLYAEKRNLPYPHHPAHRASYPFAYRAKHHPFVGAGLSHAWPAPTASFVPAGSAPTPMPSPPALSPTAGGGSGAFSQVRRGGSTASSPALSASNAESARAANTSPPAAMAVPASSPTAAPAEADHVDLPPEISTMLSPNGEQGIPSVDEAMARFLRYQQRQMNKFLEQYCEIRARSPAAADAPSSSPATTTGALTDTTPTTTTPTTPITSTPTTSTTVAVPPMPPAPMAPAATAEGTGSSASASAANSVDGDGEDAMMNQASQESTQSAEFPVSLSPPFLPEALQDQ